MIKYTICGDENYSEIKLKNLESGEEAGPYYYDTCNGFEMDPDDIKSIIKVCGQDIFEVKKSS